MQEEKQIAKWLKHCLLMLLGTILAIVLLFLIVDPYFHYHKPVSWLSYRLYDERYTNDGISRSFTFDTMITGTSMAQNFKPSEAEALFGGTCVKETFSGAGFKELSDNLDRALRRNPDLKTVIWSFEYNGLIRDKDWEWDAEYPTYLYDDNPFNDVCYIFNKTILYQGVMNNLIQTLTGQPSTTMDEYSSWDKETGLEHIMDFYERYKQRSYYPPTLEEEQYNLVKDNITQNIVELANRYPDTTFYLFYTPFSIVYWDSLHQTNTFECVLQAEQLATELVLECENIKLYNFYDQYDIITNTDNYRDKEHYGPWVNSMILEWMSQDIGLVTKDNYLEKLEKQREFYKNYDYDPIFEDYYSENEVSE